MSASSSITSPKFHLRIAGFAEGISFLLLLGVAMPLKYAADIPEAVSYTGMAHGIFFIWYIYSVIWAKSALNLPTKDMLLAGIASVIPFGTFYADYKIFRKL